jgi:ABC-type antimicrobial peptide transport system permease subunit
LKQNLEQTKVSLLKIHGTYLIREMLYRWGRSIFVVGGVGLAVSMVILLPILGQGFQSLAQLPFKNLAADLVVQQGTTKSTLPETMGLMIPYSAQPIAEETWNSLSTIEGVTEVMGTVLLWNFAPGKFFSVSGIPLKSGIENGNETKIQVNLIGPARVKEWLIKGRMPKPGKYEALVERHYGAFYSLKPGKTINIGNTIFTISGIVDIQKGSQIASANFYLDINEARRLVKMEDGHVNQLFLRVSDPAKADAAKASIHKIIPTSSVVSADSFLTLLGTLSRLTGQFQQVTSSVAGVMALLLLIVFLRGSMGERQREAAVLRAIGWSRIHVRKQLSAEAVFQGFLGGILGVLLTWLATQGLSTLKFTLPSGLQKSNDPAAFLGSQFVAPAVEANLPLTIDPVLWLTTPIVTAFICGILGWWLAGQRLKGTPWGKIRS